MSRSYEHVNRARLESQKDRINHLNNSLVRFVHGGRPGPNPLDARLVLRAPRPSIASKPSRKKKKQGIWYIVDGPKSHSTGCVESEKHYADEVLALYKQKSSEAIRGDNVPGSLLFEELLADHCAHLLRKARTHTAILRANRKKSMANTLLRLQFGGRLIGTYVEEDSHEFWAKLIAIRHNHHIAKGRDPEEEEPENYAHDCLALLKRASALYPGRHGQFWCIPIHVPKPRKRRKAREWLRKYQVMRLLLACWGFQWDWENECWKTKLVQRSDGTWYETRKVAEPDTAFLRQGISRLIRIILRTGLRHEAALLLKWGQRNNLGGVEFDDVDGNGHVHRRGLDEYNTSKSLKPTEIYEELKVILRIWAKQDGYIDRSTNTLKKADQPFIIRDKNNVGYVGYALTEFRQVCEWAGLDETTTVHALKTTAATWCKQKGYSDDAISEMLDTTVETLRKFYIHVSKEQKRTAKAEFDNRAKRQAWRKLWHLEPDPNDPKRRRDRHPPPRPLPAPALEVA